MYMPHISATVLRLMASIGVTRMSSLAKSVPEFALDIKFRSACGIQCKHKMERFVECR